jgi:hypothetical protein
MNEKIQAYATALGMPWEVSGSGTRRLNPVAFVIESNCDHVKILFAPAAGGIR